MAKYISPWIFTTQNCNLRCTYCYEKLCNKNITEKVIYDINRYFKRHIDEDIFDFVNYRVSGGEPLLNFNTWKQPILDGIIENKRKLSVSLISNLTLLNNEIESFIIDNNIGCSISLDGIDYSKPDIKGTSSSKIVKSNIERLIKNGFTKFNISSVIDKHTFNGLEKLAHFIGENKLLWAIDIDHYFYGEIEPNILISKLKEVVNILNTYNYDFYNLFRFNNIDFSNPQWGCSAGKYLIAIDVVGNIFPCQTTIDGENIGSIYNDDNLVETLKSQMKYDIGYNYKYDEQCENCSIKKLCGSGCKLHNKKENKQYTCQIIKEITYEVLTKIMED